MDRVGRGLLVVILVAMTGAAGAGWSIAPTWASYIGVATNDGNNFSATASFYRAEVLADLPASYFRLGEATGSTAIDEQSSNHGTYAGGYSLGFPGALVNDPNTAVDLDGISGRVSVPHSPVLQFSDQLTIESWVRPDTVAGSRWVVNKEGSYLLNIVDGVTSFGIQTLLGVTTVSTTVVDTGSWQHVVGTFDGITLTLYRNGVNVAQVPVEGTVAAGTSPLFIGAFDDTTSFFDGGIDEVALYGRALSSAEVLQHYQRGALTRP